MLLRRLCGRFTPYPMAVRVPTALKPFNPRFAISIEGIKSEEGSCGSVELAARLQESRPSLIRLCVRLLVRARVRACERDGLTLARPTGVACPLPVLTASANI